MKRFLLIAAILGVVLVPTTDAAVTQIIATGAMEHSELFDGPANLTVRRLTIAPGEVLGWHAHPGVGAYTIVTRGTLTVEDGCGGEVAYSTGAAFLELPNRVHRGKNLGSAEVETIQTFIVPAGTPLSNSVAWVCGAPARVEECEADGWMSFTYPRTFSSPGDCIQSVIAEKRERKGNPVCRELRDLRSNSW